MALQPFQLAHAAIEPMLLHKAQFSELLRHTKLLHDRYTLTPDPSASERDRSQLDQVLRSLTEHAQKWAKLDIVQAYLHSDQILRDVDRLYEAIRACGLRSKPATDSLLDAKRSDLMGLKKALYTIVSSPTLLAQVSSLSSDSTQVVSRAIQRATYMEKDPELSSYKDALVYLYKTTNARIPAPDLSDQISGLDDEPVNPIGNTPVYKGHWAHGEVVAVKSLHHCLSDVKKRKRFENEVAHWRSLRHPNVLPLYGLFLDKQRGCCLVNPWMKYRNILSFLDHVPEADVLQLAHDTACGLRYLHQDDPPIIHGDVRAANVLIKDDGRACIADSGLAEFVQGCSGQNGSVHDRHVRWWAPEVAKAILKDEVEKGIPSLFTQATDVYALGTPVPRSAYACMLFTSLQPYAHLPDDDLVLQQIAQGQKPVIPENAEDLAIERGLSDAVCILMESCWYDLATDRPTCHNITRTLHAIMGKLRSKSTARLAGPNDKTSFIARSLFSERNESVSSLSTYDSRRSSKRRTNVSNRPGSVRTSDSSGQLELHRHSEISTSSATTSSTPSSLFFSPNRRSRSHRRRTGQMYSPELRSPASAWSSDSMVGSTVTGRTSFKNVTLPRVSSASLGTKMGGGKERFHILITKMTSANQLNPEWAGVANMEELRAYTPAQLRKQSIIETMVEKEKKFLSSSIDTYWTNRLELDPSIIGEGRTESFVKCVLGENQSLRVIHERFLDALNVRPTLAGGCIKYVAILCNAAAKEFFSLYPEYARNLHGIIRLLSEESEKNPKFKSLMQEKLNDGSSIQSTLTSFLGEPLLHINGYTMMLQLIMKDTKAETEAEDLSALQNASQEMQRASYQVRLTSWQLENKSMAWTDLVAPAALVSGFDQDDIPRQSAIFNLISLMKDFLRQLRQIDASILVPIRSLLADPGPEDTGLLGTCKLLLQFFEELLRLHGQLLENFLTIQRVQHPLIKGYAAISGLLQMPWGPLYESLYVRCFTECSDWIENAPRASMFRQIVQRVPLHPESERRDLMASVQLPGRYLLLLMKHLRAISDLTPKQDEDRAIIIGLLSILSDISRKCDLATAQSKEGVELNWLATNITFGAFQDAEGDVDILSSSRRQVLTQNMWILKDGSIPGSQMEPIFLVLLDNYLLYIKKTGPDDDQVLEVAAKPVPVALIVEVKENPQPISKNTRRFWSFLVRLGGRSKQALTIYAEDAPSCENWAKSLKETREMCLQVQNVISLSVLHRFIRPPVSSVTALFENQHVTFFACETPQAGIWVKQREEALRLVVPLDGIKSMILVHGIKSLLILREQCVSAYQLDDLLAPAKVPISFKVDDSKTVKYMRMGVVENRDVLVLYINRKEKHVLRLIEPLRASVGAPRRRFKAKPELFRLIREITIPYPCRSIEFFKSRLIVINDLDFHLVDPMKAKDDGNAVLPLPGDPLTALSTRCQAARPLTIQKHGNEFLLCYSDFGAYVNANGRLTSKVVEWETTDARDIIFRSPWMFVIGEQFVEVRDLTTGKAEHFIPLPGGISLTWDGHDRGDLSETSSDYACHVVARAPNHPSENKTFYDQWHTVYKLVKPVPIINLS